MALHSWMMMSTSNQLSPSGSTHLQWLPSMPPDPWERRGQSTSSQWRAGSRISASCDVGVCHRSMSSRKSSFFKPSQPQRALDMFITSPDWQTPPYNGYGAPSLLHASQMAVESAQMP